MEATSLLIKDHEAVKKLFEQFEAAGDAAYKVKKAIFETIKSELLIHMDIEESIFYPAVKAQPSEELKDEIREADEEHHVAKLLIAEISKMKPEDEQYDAKVTVLRENIEHHVEEEEGELFPNTKKRLDEEMLEQLGEEMEERKAALTEDAEGVRS
jgi:iron-sulfur cluster repair protein YtfE (RIC family)